MMTKRVNGYGPFPCTIALIGQRPGKVEAYRGKPFVGPSGDMLNDYLLAAGIDRASCYTTNVVKTFEGTDDVTEAEIEADLPDLRAELLKCQPKYIGLLGRVAVDVMLPWVADKDMYWCHGLMFGWQAPWGYVRLMPCYHPAAGMHQTSIQGATAWDFERFGMMVRGELTQCHQDKTVVTDYVESRTYLNLDRDALVAIDTEGSVKHPWCASMTGHATMATVVRTGLVKIEGTLVMHHSLHDLAVLKAMGVTVTRFEDTMLKATLLGVEPHGLKDLARRHLGLRLRHYDDLVASVRREKAINYLGNVIEWLNTLSVSA
jgi:uracil-DNA glycosylase family 4